MRPCNPVDASFFDSANARFTTTRVLDATPDVVFAVLEDGESWPRWVPAIKRVTWGNEKPFGIGTTRRVHMAGGLVADEHFFRWDHGRGFSFYFLRGSLPGLESFAEEYTVRPLDGGRSELTWRVAFQGTNAVANVVHRASVPMLRFGFTQMGRNLAKYVRDANSGVATASA